MSSAPTRRLVRDCRLAVGLLVVIGGAVPAFAQQQPFIVHDTRPVVMHGPWISSLSPTTPRASAPAATAGRAACP